MKTGESDHEQQILQAFRMRQMGFVDGKAAVFGAAEHHPAPQRPQPYRLLAVPRRVACITNGLVSTRITALPPGAEPITTVSNTDSGASHPQSYVAESRQLHQIHRPPMQQTSHKCFQSLTYIRR